MENAIEILTADEVAAWLKLSKAQIYELSKQRTRNGKKRVRPMPAVRIGSSVRYIRTQVEEWLHSQSCYEEGL